MEIEEMPKDEQRYAVRAGDLLVVEGHANPQEIGRCALAGPEAQGLLHQNHLFRLSGSCLLPRLAEYLLNSPSSRSHWLARSGTSSGLYTISRRALLDLPLPVIPTALQRRIVEVLDAVTEAERSIEAAIAKQRSLRGDIFAGLVADDCEGRRVTDVVELPSGQVDPRGMPYREQVLLAPDHVESRTGRVIGKETAEFQGAVSGKYVVQPDDVVLSKIRPALRKVALADFVGTCSADMYPLRVTSEVLPKFLWVTLLSEEFSRFAESVSGRTGIPKLNRKDLALYSMCVPPLNDQQRIVETLDAWDLKVANDEHELQKLRVLKQGLADDLLSGRVRADAVA
ncbi:hypothetical protein HEP86_19535 [Streptomyces sp. RPA4-5]|uniref:restriction endonuclease subunit S n=1 Tax=Streptomyces sp. RPA4-5 TaxID=2721245 RepID=UPI00143EEBB8|nr:restriction endonuclease subunit S [Streptomyces sp. RPA4-5]QIY56313.1 hypothetical protein HEP86_19535 [Streptomyces sp. RPA4-5]